MIDKLKRQRRERAQDRVHQMILTILTVFLVTKHVAKRCPRSTAKRALLRSTIHSSQSYCAFPRSGFIYLPAAAVFRDANLLLNY